MKHQPGLVITADDFGLHPSVNEAVERSHREGVLQAASLMVAEPAAADAVERARACPGLRVGLHLVLADGCAVLPREQIPGLVGMEGRFGEHMARDGLRYALSPRLRRQLAAEIHAQFEAFAATGLKLDHVNAHKHFQLHPAIAAMIVEIGRPYGVAAVRVPRGPGMPRWLAPWLAILERRLGAAGIAHNDFLAGVAQSGQFDELALLDTLSRLPARGLAEIYLHPALVSGAQVAPSMRGYRHADEFAALVSPRVRSRLDRLRERGIAVGGYSDLAAMP